MHGAKLHCAAPGDESEHQEQAEQDQPHIGREQQEPDIDRERVPIAALIEPDGAPEMQKRERPERHRQDRGAEIRARYAERRDARHQQGRKRRMPLADRQGAELEHRPIGHDHAKLRQRIDAGQAAEPERDLREPVSERRTRVRCRTESRNRWRSRRRPRPAARHRTARGRGSRRPPAPAPPSRR